MKLAGLPSWSAGGVKFVFSSTFQTHSQYSFMPLVILPSPPLLYTPPLLFTGTAAKQKAAKTVRLANISWRWGQPSWRIAVIALLAPGLTSKGRRRGPIARGALSGNGERMADKPHLKLGALHARRERSTRMKREKQLAFPRCALHLSMPSTSRTQTRHRNAKSAQLERTEACLGWSISTPASLVLWASTARWWARRTRRRV
jgi:hypothetical protein